ncbi:MAG: hypothetical protein RL030_797 [Pseudomonadota bacterium]
MGIEPTAQAWEAWVLPLYDARLPPMIFSFPCRDQLIDDASLVKDEGVLLGVFMVAVKAT